MKKNFKNILQFIVDVKHVGKSWSYDIVSSNPRTIATWKAF